MDNLMCNEQKNKEALFNVLLSNLGRFDDFCKQYDLKYYAFGGTLLGAVRHKGFIPWDDDIDLCMLRKDYNKLLELIDVVDIEEPYKFLNPLTDRAFHKGFVRFANIKTTEIPIKDAMYDYNQGVFIDVFPIDAVPDDDDLFKKQVKKLKICMKLMRFASRYYSRIKSKGLSGAKKLAYYILCPAFFTGLLNTRKIFLYYDKVCSQFENINTKRVGEISFAWDDDRFIFERNDFDGIDVDVKFENIVLKAPANFDAILRKSYGDYMTPVKQSSEHGTTIFDANVPYSKYKEEHYKELESLWIKSLKKS
jgi:lipopolysaccharide cholinephosphotransferase